MDLIGGAHGPNMAQLFVLFLFYVFMAIPTKIFIPWWISRFIKKSWPGPSAIAVMLVVYTLIFIAIGFPFSTEKYLDGYVNILSMLADGILGFNVASILILVVALVRAKLFKTID